VQQYRSSPDRRRLTTNKHDREPSRLSTLHYLHFEEDTLEGQMKILWQTGDRREARGRLAILARDRMRLAIKRHADPLWGKRDRVTVSRHRLSVATAVTALSQRVTLIYESTWERFSSLAYRREMDFPRKIFIAINFHGSAAGVAACISGSNRAEGLKDLRRLGEPHRPWN